MAASAGSPAIPDSLKNIRPYMLVAKDFDARDPCIAYYCRRYAVEISHKMKNRPDDATRFLIALLDQLEEKKKELIGRNPDVISNDLVASAHVEEYAIKLFNKADTDDRNSIFNKGVVKSFHTAGILFDVLQSFGEISEEITQMRKYAKWKATYIHGCLKRGETPVAGPVGGEDEEGAAGGAPLPHPSSLQPGPPPPTLQEPGYPPMAGAIPPGAGAYPPAAGAYPPAAGAYPPGTYPPAQPPSVNQLAPSVPPGQHAPPSTPDQGGGYQSGMPGPSTSTPGVPMLSPKDTALAQKYCKFAGSALQYDDVANAIENLEKALRILKTGKE